MDNAVVSGILTGLITGIVLALLVWSWRQWVRRTTSEKFEIELNISPKMEMPQLKFGVLYVQNEDGTIINTTHWFRKKRKGKWCTVICHPRNLGFQYKCFVDNHSSYSSSDIMTWLTEEGYSHVSVGGGKPGRLWFILPDKSITQDPLGNINNYYYPE